MPLYVNTRTELNGKWIVGHLSDRDYHYNQHVKIEEVHIPPHKSLSIENIKEIIEELQEIANIMVAAEVTEKIASEEVSQSPSGASMAFATTQYMRHIIKDRETYSNIVLDEEGVSSLKEILNELKDR